MTAHQLSGRTGAVVRLMLYAAIVVTPLVLVAVINQPTDHNFVYTVGKNLALVGFTIIAMQFVLSARCKWIERSFGLNMLFTFHKVMGIIAALFVMSHPILLAIGSDDWTRIFGLQTTWDIWLGRLALILLIVSVVLAIIRVVISLNYETWRFVHNVGAVLILTFAFVHSWNAGGDFGSIWMKLFWSAQLVTAITCYLLHRFVRRRQLKKHPFSVTGMRKEAPGVWTIELTQPPGVARFDFIPGQFHFITFQRAPHLPVEDHPWSISSSPSTLGVLCSTIKESGDFTASIDKTKVGDTALVDGPFGRFSYVLHPDEHDLVFIAGGIGITPIMSMLRHIRDTRAQLSVTLIYANTHEENIVFREELSAMEHDGVAGLKVILVLSNASDEWKGERGRIDSEKLLRLVGPELGRHAFYICAPSQLMQHVVQALRKAHVPAKRIHFEQFNL